jgi:Holliday junction resolvase RusA-like endonuclease
MTNTTASDSDKLSRLILDGLEMAGVLVNDSQVWHMTASKVWGTVDRTHVTLRT